jgi:hypothetical protein
MNHGFTYVVSMLALAAGSLGCLENGRRGRRLVVSTVARLGPYLSEIDGGPYRHKRETSG